MHSVWSISRSTSRFFWRQPRDNAYRNDRMESEEVDERFYHVFIFFYQKKKKTFIVHSIKSFWYPFAFRGFWWNVEWRSSVFWIATMGVLWDDRRFEKSDDRNFCELEGECCVECVVIICRRFEWAISVTILVVMPFFQLERNEFHVTAAS